MLFRSDNRIAQAILEELGEPLMSSTLILPGDNMPLTDPQEMRSRLEHAVDLVIDGGHCGVQPTTVVELLDRDVAIARVGKGDPSAFVR